MLDAVQSVRAGGPPADWRQLTIFLDGEEVRNVVAASARHGWVVRAVVDEEGRWVADPRDPNRLAQEMAHGRVLIIRRLRTVEPGAPKWLRRRMAEKREM